MKKQNKRTLTKGEGPGGNSVNSKIAILRNQLQSLNIMFPIWNTGIDEIEKKYIFQ